MLRERDVECESFDSGDDGGSVEEQNKKSRSGKKVKLFSGQQRGPWKNISFRKKENNSGENEKEGVSVHLSR